VYTYTCLITDDRYQVRSLIFEAAPDDVALRAKALSELADNPHYQDFEARRDDAQVFLLRRQDLHADR
jgi:hypothetical protein